jgi:ankyrin repeat protein
MLEALPGGADAARAAGAGGKTPLLLAACAAEGGCEAAQFLVERGADPAAADEVGARGAPRAVGVEGRVAEKEHPCMHAWLHTHAHACTTNHIHNDTQAGNTAMHMAAISGNTAVARLLLSTPRAGALAAAANARGRTPLHFAAVFGHEQVARELMLHGADVNAADQDGCTALHMLCQSVMLSPPAALALARRMLAAGARPAAADAQGCGCADYASSDALRQLLGGGAAATSGGGGAQQQEEEGGQVRAAAEVAPSASKVQAAVQKGLESSGVAITIDGPGPQASPAAAAAAASRTNSFLAKEALRKHTSEEPDGWKLGAHISQP